MNLTMATCLLLAQEGAIRGRISPEAQLRIVAVLHQQDASKPENVKGEITLGKGGAFEIKELAPGKYTLHFQLQGEDARKYHAKHWGEIEVQAGRTVDGIHYRLTPRDADHMIDEILLDFAPGVPEAARAKAIDGLGCRVKARSPNRGAVVVDIPDDKSVAELLEAARKLPEVALAERNRITQIR